MLNKVALSKQSQQTGMLYKVVFIKNNFKVPPIFNMRGYLNREKNNFMVPPILNMLVLSNSFKLPPLFNLRGSSNHVLEETPNMGGEVISKVHLAVLGLLSCLLKKKFSNKKQANKQSDNETRLLILDFAYQISNLNQNSGY